MKTPEEWAVDMWQPLAERFVSGKTFALNMKPFIEAIQTDAFNAGKIAGLREGSTIAAAYSIEGKPIHPDIDVEHMNEPAKVVYHTTCQHVAQAIEGRADELEKGIKS